MILIVLAIMVREPSMLSRAKRLLQTPFVNLKLKWLTYRLKSKNLDTRGRVIRALGQLRDSRAIPLLLPLLHHDDGLIRYATADALGYLNDPQAIEPLLVAHANEPDPYTRMWMAVSLMYLGNSHPLKQLFEDVAIIDTEGNVDWDSGPIIALTIAHLGEQVLPILAKVITHPNFTVRWITIMALYEMKNENAIDLLKQAQDDEDEFIRDEVSYMLKKVGAK